MEFKPTAQATESNGNSDGKRQIFETENSEPISIKQIRAESQTKTATIQTATESQAKPSIVESIREVERLYSFFNKKFNLGLDLNNLVVTIEETNANTMGYFRPSESPKAWYKDLAFKHQAQESQTESESKTATETETATEQDESINHICLNSNHLRAKPYETATHEYAHFLNKVLDKYKGNYNNYHTAQFKKRAEELLLKVSKGTYGFNQTAETEEFNKMIEEEFKPSETAFLIFQETEQQRAERLGLYPKDENGNPIIPPKAEPKGRLLKWVCDCGYIIRATRNGTKAEPLKAVCQFCQSEFKIQEPSRAEPEQKEPEQKARTPPTDEEIKGIGIKIKLAVEKHQAEKKAEQEDNLFNEITEINFNDYERAREEGKINMFDLRAVEDLSGLSRDKLKMIMKNYDKLAERYKDE